MTKALITGASGFIGGHLAEALLRQNDQVRCLVRRTSNVEHLPADKVEFAYADLRDEAALHEAVKGVDVVYHLAAMTCSHSADAMMKANACGTEAIAAACAAQVKVPVLVAVSSIAASGPVALGQVRTENDPPAPVSIYGRSKLAGEEACRKYADRVPTTIVRASIVFGPRNREMLPVFRTIRRFRFHAVPGRNPPPLSYVHVEDLVQLLAICAAKAPRLASGAAGDQSPGQGIYFASMEEHPDYAELGKIIRKLVDRPRAPMVYMPPAVAYPIAAMNQSLARLCGRCDTFNVDKIREATVSSWACSGKAASRDLDTRITTSLNQRLAETVDWYRSAGWL